MKVLELGHVNLWVTDLNRSSDFYRDLLGIPEVARGVLKKRRVAFLSLGPRHHDLALVEVGGAAIERSSDRPGLNHIGFKVGDCLDELRQMRAWLARHNLTPHRCVDHGVCKSIHVYDPDGNVVELYVDGNPQLWAESPQSMVCSEPFQLD